MNDILSYDLEASDTDVRHGQVFQFGAIRAAFDDMSPEETVNIRVRRLPYLVPSPGALAVTGIDPRSIDDAGLASEFEAARLIHRTLRPSAGDTRYFLTFNGIRYDDELLRTTFWRNLLDPYVTSGRQARRIDVLPLMQFAAYLSPGSLSLKPADAEGRWRLESVAPLNGIHVNAHDAVGDATATLGLARIIRDRVPFAWNTAARAAEVRWTDGFLNPFGAQKQIVWVFTHFGVPELVPCASVAKDGKVSLMARLDRDPEQVIGLDIQPIGESLFSKDSLVQTVRGNATPLVMTSDEVLGLFPEKRNEIDIIRQRFQRVNEASGIAGKLLAALKHSRETKRKNPEAGPDRTSEERIYEGFPTDPQRIQMRRFHEASDWIQRARLALGFRDARLDEFAARLVCMHGGFSPKELRQAITAAEAEAIEAHWSRTMARPGSPDAAPWMTLQKARNDAAVLGADAARFIEWLDIAFECEDRPAEQLTLF